jgi:predicted DNA-binding transcriptional regulator AlpA
VNDQRQEPGKILDDALRDELKELVREAIREEQRNSNDHLEEDRLLTPKQAAEILGQTVRWVYGHAGKLPFTRRINRKNLRFSEAGLRRWITLRKRDSRR